MKRTTSARPGLIKVVTAPLNPLNWNSVLGRPGHEAMQKLKEIAISAKARFSLFSSAINKIHNSRAMDMGWILQRF